MVNVCCFEGPNSAKAMRCHHRIGMSGCFRYYVRFCGVALIVDGSMFSNHSNVKHILEADVVDVYLNSTLLWSKRLLRVVSKVCLVGCL